MKFVYILTSLNHPNKTYTGITFDLEKRLKEHNEQQEGYSKRYAPWKIQTYIAFENEEKAHAFEAYLKEGSGFSFMKRRLL